MTPIRAVVRDRRIEVPAPEGLPDGTEVRVELTPVTEQVGIDKSEWDDTPEGAEAWLKWYDSLEPLVFTDEERARLSDVLTDTTWH